jgi:ethanolamine ammonia-lyase small subunit
MRLPGRRDDPWQALRSRTPARIALGRAGTSLPTAELLRFAMDHAQARDAVQSEADFDALATELPAHEHGVIHVRSSAQDRDAYVRFPEHGQQLCPSDRERLSAAGPLGAGLALIIGDGLSAAALRHAAPLTKMIIDELARSPAVTIGPLVLVRYARVAVQDDIGDALRAGSALIVLGERPGLGAADSLSAYFVYGPRPGRTNAERNCVSNIRPAGLPLAAAAGTIAYLIRRSLALGASGVALKDERTPTAPHAME